MFHVWDGRIAEWQEYSMFGMGGGMVEMFYVWDESRKGRNWKNVPWLELGNECYPENRYWR